MKIVTSEEAEAHQRATVIGGVKGFLGGLSVAGAGSYILHHRSNYYRHLPPSIKALGVVSIAVPSFVIAAERAGLKFERDQWSDAGKEEMEVVQSRKEARLAGMTATERALDWASQRQYSIIFGGWAASLVGSFGYIMRNKYETLPMKIVQARMYAQGLTLGMIIAAGALTSIQRHQKKQEDHADHSWRDVLAAQEAEDARVKAALARGER